MKFKALTTTALAALLSLGSVSTAHAVQEGELLIWINGDKGFRGLAEVGRRFEAELGVRVRVEAPEGVTDRFFQAAQSGQGPDIFFWPHDRLGEWADAGLLRPVDVNTAFREKFFPMSWEAFTHNGRLWAYPVSLEAVGLIYNRAAITEAPRTLEDIIAMAPALREKEFEPIMWDYNNTYFTWGVLASHGGYVFGYEDGAFNVRDVGVNHPGAIKGLATIVRMIEEGVMPRGVSYNVMEARMNSGDLAMMISGPWAWANLRRSGIDFGVAPVPGVEGNVGRPFVGVLGAMINRASPNTDLAELFLREYLLTNEGLRAMDNDVPLGVPALKSFYEELSGNPLIRGSKESVDAGMLMPNVPQMGRFWSAMGSALSNATNGQLTAEEALNQAAQRIRPRN